MKSLMCECVPQTKKLKHLSKDCIMLCSHCSSIRLERYDWPIVVDRGTFPLNMTWIRRDECRYVHVRFAALGCDMIAIGQFQAKRSATISSPVQIIMITYVYTGLSRSSQRWGPDLTQLTRSGFPIWYHLIRAGTF